MLKLIAIPITAFIACELIGPSLIPFLHKLKFGQSIRECGPACHMKKRGTPTMGCLMMLAALLLALLWGSFTPHVIIALVLTLGHAVIGFIDDYIKVVMKRNLGLTGACLGFLMFNRHPAKVFMGDTGSLALGGGIAALALLTRTELLLVIIGGVYVAEALSVIIQVTYFRLTGGKRIFRMSPLHHHFELGGWDEVKVVRVFSIVSCLLSAVGLGLWLAAVL